MRRIRSRGYALLISLASFVALCALLASYMQTTFQVYANSTNRSNEVTCTEAADGAIESSVAALYVNFTVQQSFSVLAPYTSASTASPVSLNTVAYSNGVTVNTSVIGYQTDGSRGRIITVQAIASYGNAPGIRYHGNPRMTITHSYEFTLNQSPVFDYMEFMNNYLHHDNEQNIDQFFGDIRSNGNLSVSGTFSVNGSMTAAPNPYLLSQGQGLISGTTTTLDSSSYASAIASNSRRRPLYDSSVFGAVGSSTYNQIGSLTYNPTSGYSNNSPYGDYRADATGVYAFNSAGTSSTLLSSQGTSTVAFPTMPSISTYQSASASWTDTTQTYADGSSNPKYGQGPYVEMWLGSPYNTYGTVTSNGYYGSTAVLQGTAAHPLKIHGPVTFANDVIISGYVSGQGTIVAGRNVHIVGSLLYSNPPNFQQSTATAELANAQKSDALGLMAEGSIIMGPTADQQLYTMEPPNTQARYDTNGNLIPAWNGTDIDSWGVMKCKSILSDSQITSLCSPLNEIDAACFSSHFIGGEYAPSGGQFTLYGSLIGCDAWNVPDGRFGSMTNWNFNYDPRFHSRPGNLGPICNLNFPASPQIQSLIRTRGNFSP